MKERASVKSPYLHIQQLPERLEEGNVYRLFKMNRLMNHLHITQAVPYMFKSFTPIKNFAYDDLKNKYTKLEDKPGHFFKLRLQSQSQGASLETNSEKLPSFILHHSSLYRV